MARRPDPVSSLLSVMDRRAGRARLPTLAWGDIDGDTLTLDTGDVFELGTYAVWGIAGEGRHPVFYMQGGHDVLVLGDFVPAFEPDWHALGVEVPFDPTTIITITNIPAGAAGDVLCLFMILNGNAFDQYAVITSITQHDSLAVAQGSMTVRTEDFDGATFISATGVRCADFGDITLALSPGCGDFAYAFGNFPPGSLSTVLVDEDHGAGEALLDLTVIPPGAGIFAGFVVSDENFGVGVTTPGAGTLESVNADTAPAYEFCAWSYGTGAADAQFDLTGNYIYHAAVLGG